MKRWLFKISTFLLVAFLTIGMAVAQTVYVNKANNALLYTQADVKSSVVTNLPKGTAANLLKTNLANGFSYISTNKDQNGWIKTSFLQAQPPVIHKKGFFAKLWTGVFGKHTSLAHPKPHPSSHAALSNVSNLALTQEFYQLQNQVIRLQAEQHPPLFWFIWGAGIAIVAFMLGLLFSGFRSKRRSSRSLFH